MKSRVMFSVYCIVVTLVIIIAFIIGIIAVWEVRWELFLMSVILVGMICSGLYYSPTSIETGDSSLIIHRYIKPKKIPYSEIAKAERCYPSSGSLRLCGSGGFMGYWGYFSDIMIGTYFGYYGRQDQCIFIKLRNDKQYVISCESPDKLLKYITDKLSK